jgi:hypothetical protein
MDENKNDKKIIGKILYPSESENRKKLEIKIAHHCKT